jgi:hypothetical protein
MTGNDSYQGFMGSDTGWIYMVADGYTYQGIYLSASGDCRLSSALTFIEFYVAGSRRGTVSSSSMDMLVPITSTAKISSTNSLESPRYIITGSGTGAVNLQAPNIATSYYELLFNNAYRITKH